MTQRAIIRAEIICQKKCMRNFFHFLVLGFLVAPLGMIRPANSEVEFNKQAGLRTLMSGIPHSLDVTNVKTLVEWTLLYNIGLPLVGGGPDGTISPGIAKTWVIDKSDKSITFHLGKHYFSDGSKVTAKDVIATLEYHCKNGGTKKINLAESLAKKCSKDSLVEKSPFVVKIFFNVSPNFVLPYFSIADLIILSEKSIANYQKTKNWKSLFSPSSGPYWLETINNDEIVLNNNRHFNFVDNNIFESVSISEISRIENLSEWFNSNPNYVLRVPEFEKINGEDKLFYSENFWSRFGAFVGGAKKTVIKDRKLISQIITSSFAEATEDAKLYMFLPPFRNNKEKVNTNLMNSKAEVKILVSSFSFAPEKLDKFTELVKSRMPNCNFLFAKTPKEFVALLESAKIDVVISQVSFGPIDLMPSFMSTLLKYSLNDKNFDTFYSDLKQVGSLDERRKKIINFGEQLETNGTIFGLGPFKAKFLVSKGVKTSSDKLLTGELYFSNFVKERP